MSDGMLQFFNLITRIEGYPVKAYTYMFEVIDDTDYVSETEAEERLRSAIRDFLKTEEGHKAWEDTSRDFNWGDAMIMVPDEYWAKYGLMLLITDNVTIEVNHDELLAEGIYDRWGQQNV